MIVAKMRPRTPFSPPLPLVTKMPEPIAAPELALNLFTVLSLLSPIYRTSAASRVRLLMLMPPGLVQAQALLLSFCRRWNGFSCDLPLDDLMVTHDSFETSVLNELVRRSTALPITLRRWNEIRGWLFESRFDRDRRLRN